MLNRDIIQNRGFTNTVSDGLVTGFELLVRNPNYRGLSGSLVDGVAVAVDGRTWDHEQTSVVLQGREMTLTELRTSTDVRWALDEPMVVKVPLTGGLAPGVHAVAVDIRLRAPYIPIEFQPGVFHAERSLTLLGPATSSPLRHGVSLYSFTGDMGTLLTLEDAMAEIHDLGATGIEILGEGNIPGYPNPSAAWIDTWKALLEKYSLTPTNYGSWIDSRMWLHRDLTAQEGHEALARDVRLAAELGFSFVRPKIGVVSQDLVPHPIWDEAVERTLDLAAEKNIVICPEIHAPTPIRHPVVDDYLAFIERTGTKNFGLLIDTGIFMTRPAIQELDSRLGDDEEDIPVPLRALKVPPSDLIDILEHVVFIQAKFYDVDENLVDQNIPWPEVLRVLTEHGYTGYLSSEYEGPRDPYRGIVQVRRQHAMFRELEKHL
ncbi:sugar phosphate isomerase/epimerase [Actinotalea sp. M2MS4P-6]|uniref:sugar phosphate isomerase/epimerase n=1 Tax=Actinotalea sp. M2MS4P-6 TaxID=2983762 RepID=UPI0021E41419|nr:sugar phosphate isomerase/epimerase [Actinotalea sp. M2MS4P-6]MCV2395665.1 sugar phosphate isomerase/epimerase [Actinotalea sp. M2MS4P-6]